MKLKNFCLLALCLLCANHQAFADDKDEPVQRWAIQAGFGGTTLLITHQTDKTSIWVMKKETISRFRLTIF